MSNLMSATFVIHAPAPGRPDRFLCRPNSRFGSPVATSVANAVSCKSCLRHVVTQYRATSTADLLATLKLMRNERRIAAVNSVLRERDDYWQWLADQARPFLVKN